MQHSEHDNNYDFHGHYMIDIHHWTMMNGYSSLWDKHKAIVNED